MKLFEYVTALRHIFRCRQINKHSYRVFNRKGLDLAAHRYVKEVIDPTFTPLHVCRASPLHNYDPPTQYPVTVLFSHHHPNGTHRYWTVVTTTYLY